MQQGLIYDPTSSKRIYDFLSTQEEELNKIDKEQDTKKIIRYGVILGISALAIIVLKLVVKNRKK